MQWTVLVVLAWTTLFLVALAAAAGRRRASPLAEGPTREGEGAALAPALDRRTLRLLLAIALAVVLVRAPLAVGREVRNVDEFQYAATAEFARWSGESVFGSPRNVGLHQLLYLAGSLERPFLAADLGTSLAVGLTSLLLGLTLLRAGGDRRAALLIGPCYALLLLRFEGLSSNKEPWVGLCLAAWALCRLGRPPHAPLTSWRRQLVAGACLGAAATMKEQAIPLLLCEPLLELRDQLAAEGQPGARARAFLAHQGLAALGYWLPLLAFLGCYALHGQLGAYLSFIAEMAGTGGTPNQDLARLLELPPPPAEIDLAAVGPPLPIALADALLRYALGPVGLLGCVGAISLLVEASELRARERRPALGFLLLALLGGAAASIGRRWFGHYLMLACLGLAGLAVWRGLRALEERRRPETRAAAWALLGLALLASLNAALTLWTVPDVARGAGLDAEELAELRELGAELQRYVPAGERILVWGWRPELYFAAQRAPAVRYVCGLTARKAEVVRDLERYGPPAALILPGERGLAAQRYEDADGQPRRYDPYALGRHAWLVDYLRGVGYLRLPPVRGYTVLVRLDLKAP
ncbi:MAG: hypothetical protein AB7N76_20255 [Planctomycetota bacterium]